MTAQTQEGLFTTQQAAESGFSPQLLVHHAQSGRVLRVQRGIYRIVHYPAGAQEDLVAACYGLTERASCHTKRPSRFMGCPMRCRARSV